MIWASVVAAIVVSGLGVTVEAAPSAHREAAINSIDHGRSVHHRDGPIAMQEDDAAPVSPPHTGPQATEPPVEAESPVFLVAMVVLAIAGSWLFVARGWQRLPSPTGGGGARDALMPLVLFVLMVFLLQLGAAAGIAIVAREAPETEGAAAMALSLRDSSIVRLVSYAAALPVLGAAISLRRTRRDRGDEAATSNVRAMLLGGASLLLIYPFVSLAGIAASIVQQQVTGEAPDAVAHQTLHMLEAGAGDPWRWVMIGLVIIGAPLYEEVMYRGLLQTALVRLLYARWAAIVLSAALFAAVHIGAVEPFALANLFVLGVGFGWIYEKTGRLAAPVAAHAAFNVLNLVLALLVM